MKKYLSACSALLALTLMYTSGYAQDNPLFRHIPPDANAIYDINMAALTAKISWADLIAGMPIPHDKPSDQEIMEIIRDPARAGIDIQGDILITQHNKAMMDSAGYTLVLLHLLDSSKFRIYLSKGSPGLRVTRYPNRSYSAYKNKIGVAWNNDLAVMVIGKYSAQAISRSVAALRGYGSSFYTTDPGFMAAFSNDADIHMYTEQSSYLNALRRVMPRNPAMGMNMDSMSMVGKTISSIRFEPGKITMHSSAQLKPWAAVQLEKSSPPPFDPEELARLPKGDLLGAIGMRLDLSLTQSMLQRIGFRGKVDSLLAAKGLSLDDICHAFKGDFLLAMVAPGHRDSLEKPKPAFYFVAAIGDSAALRRLGNKLDQAKDLSAGDSTGNKRNLLSKMKNNFAIRGNTLVISGSKEQAEGYLDNTEKRNIDFVTDPMREDPVFVWIDLKSLANLFLGPASPDGGGTDKKTRTMNAVRVLDKLTYSGGAIKNGQMESYFELKLGDEQQNALRTLLNLAHQVSQ